MMRYPMLNLGVEVERADESSSGNRHKQKQSDPTLSRHNPISRLSFTWRYL